MNRFMVVCDELSKYNCLKHTYCGWCIDNYTNTYYCKDINICYKSNINISNECEINTNKYNCVIDDIVLSFLVLLLYILCVFVFTELIKVILKKILLPKKNVRIQNHRQNENFPSEYTALLYESFETVYLENSINVDEKNNSIIQDNYDSKKYNEINQKIDKICKFIGSFIFIGLGVLTIYLYYTNIFSFVIELFVVCSIVVILGFCVIKLL